MKQLLHNAVDGMLQRGWMVVTVSTAVVLPALLLMPMMLYMGNVTEFSVSLRHMLPGVLWFAASVWLVLAGLLMVLPVRAYRHAVALALGTAILFWVQGHILVWDYGVLDGRTIDWARQWWRGLIDGLVWIAVLAAFYRYAHSIYRRGSIIAVSLLALAAISAILELRAFREPPGHHSYTIDHRHKFDFSADCNVVILVLDAFQADVMQEILNLEPEFRKLFEGFQFYRNAASGYSKTYTTFALLLTGEWYENRQPVQQFLRDSFERSSITTQLLDAGWRVDLFPHAKHVLHYSDNVASNMVLRVDAEKLAGEAGRLIDTAMFRASPHFLKPWWMNHYQWRLQRLLPVFTTEPVQERTGYQKIDHPHPAVRFVREFEANARVALDVPAFKLYHLNVPHAPFILSEDLDMQRLPPGREGFRRHSMAALEITRRLIAGIRKLGLYDNTMLLVVSDHGGGEYDVGVGYDMLAMESERGKLRKITAEAITGGEIADRHHQSALPLLMIKPFAARGPLKISDAPVSLGDIAATLATELDLGRIPPGENIHGLDETARRERRYLYYEFDGWSRDYLPAMTEYQVAGHSWLPHNWHATGRILQAHEQLPTRIKPRAEMATYTPGEMVTISDTVSYYEPWLVSGWSEPKANHVWSERHEAVLRIPLRSPIDHGLRACFLFRPFTVPEALPAQIIDVALNGTHITRWVARRKAWYQADIPAAMIRDRQTLEFRFTMPDAASPLDYRRSLDNRTLGISLQKLILQPQDLPPCTQQH